ncbi:COG1361 S-layer family protein [Haloplanus salilacus]|uniref:COG1361 S-layer family protein n=1 Tax=Haloplanus salilacus TaxID=2949994 RepID=UPI0030D48F85
MNEQISNGVRLFLSVVVALSLVLSAAATPVAAASYDEYQEPELVPTIQGSNVVAPGETATLTVQLQNRGTAVTHSDGNVDRLASVVDAHGVTPGTATATTVTVDAGGAPLEVDSGPQSAGSISPRSEGDVSLELDVDEGASPGTYELPVVVEYQYIHRISADADDFFIVRNDVRVTKHVTVRIDESFRLDVVGVTSENLRHKEDGTVSVTVRNAGSETGTDTELQLLETGQLRPRTNGVSLGRLESGETATAEFRVGVRDIEAAGNYSVGVRANYEDEDGTVKQSEIRRGTVGVEDAPSFTLDASTESLYVDSTGAVALTVTNTGDRPVRNARAVLHPTEPFSPLSTSASLGTLDPGESATTRFKLEVADRAVPQTYPLVYTVEYDDAYDERVTSEERTVSADVGPEMTIETSGSPAVAAGSTETIDVTVRNTGDDVMRDAVARINVNTPFETDDDTAYVGDLAPGESRTVTFTVSVDDEATPKAYTVDTTVKYDNAFDRTVVTGTESTSVTVTEGGGGLLETILDIFGL